LLLPALKDNYWHTLTNRRTFQAMVSGCCTLPVFPASRISCTCYLRTAARILFQKAYPRAFQVWVKILIYICSKLHILFDISLLHISLLFTNTSLYQTTDNSLTLHQLFLYSPGVFPVIFLNSLLKFFMSLKPTSERISVTFLSVVFKRVQASEILRFCR